MNLKQKINLHMFCICFMFFSLGPFFEVSKIFVLFGVGFIFTGLIGGRKYIIQEHFRCKNCGSTNYSYSFQKQFKLWRTRTWFWPGFLTHYDTVSKYFPKNCSECGKSFELESVQKMEGIFGKILTLPFFVIPIFAMFVFALIYIVIILPVGLSIYSIQQFFKQVI